VLLAGNTITGAVALTRNATELVVAGNTIGCSLSCSGNDPALLPITASPAPSPAWPPPVLDAGLTG
jgi:hypothetical protein